VRILHVTPRMDPGGAERIVLQLAADASRMGHRVWVASQAGAWVGRLGEVGARHLPLPLGRRSPASVLASAAGLRRALGRLRPDLVHAHNPRAAAAVRLAGRAGDHASLCTVHGLAPSDYPAAARVLRRCRCRVVACSPAVAAALEAAGYRAGPLEVVTNGARLAPAPPERVAALRQALGLGPGPVVVGVGRLVDQKDWPTLIEAAQGLDGASVLVAGEGRLRPRLEALAARAGGRVRFVGHVDDVAALLGLADCVVSASAWEGLPLALLEALSLGRPVVATAVDGVAGLLPPGAALLVGRSDRAATARALAGAIRQVLDDPALAARLSAGAAEASQAWSPEAMLAGYRRAYARARGRPQPLVATDWAWPSEGRR
jgi:glycosyltransferase involved in cell wall biosynthesis